MTASNIPLNHSMHFSNRGHPTKPYHKTIKIPFNYGHLSGCLHDMRLSRRREFTPVPPHGLCICLHDTTTKCHAGASHPGVSSSRLLYRGENFTPIRNLATVTRKRKTTIRFGVNSVCRWPGTGSACVMFAILNRTCI